MPRRGAPSTLSRDPLPIVVLISGTGSNLAALLDASRTPDCPYEVVAVIADRDADGLEHARAAQIPTEVVRLGDHPDRAAWDQALAAAVGTHSPHLVVLAGFMKLVGPRCWRSSAGASSTPTLPCCPPSPAPTACAMPSPTASRSPAAASSRSMPAWTPGGSSPRRRGRPREDTEQTLHERIKAVEQPLLVDVVRRLTAAG